MSNDITVKPNGPYLLAGPCKLIDPTGTAIEIVAGKIVALCRCGQSKQKPFCDSTHKTCGFVASEAAPGPRANPPDPAPTA